MFDFKGLVTGRDKNELRPGERALQLHLAPVIIIAGGALMVLVSMFLPTMSSDQFATISGNMLIQNDPALLLCSVAATISAVRYWKTGSRASANLAILAGVWFLIWTVIDSQGLTVNGAHYIPGEDENGDPTMGVTVNSASAASAAAGLWAAGVGCLLVALSGLMMRFPHLSFGLASGAVAPKSEQAAFPGTKVCPRCAETLKGAAKVCRFCQHEFEPAERV